MFSFLAPTLSAPTLSSSIGKRRWTPFADIVSSDQSKSCILPNTISISKSQTVPLMDSSVSLNSNSLQKETNQSTSSLTNVVKNAMNKGQLSVPSKTIRRPTSGTTLSTKDLNHLSPQSM